MSYFVGILSGVGDIFLPGSVAALGNFLRKVIKKLKLQNNNNNKKRTWIYFVNDQKKKKTHTHTHKYIKFYNFLLRVFIF